MTFLARCFLTAVALVYGACGVLFLINPEGLQAAIFLSEAPDDFLIEMQALYGGGLLALGLFWGLSAWTPLLHAMLLQAGLLNGLLLVGRVVGISQYEVTDQRIWLYGISELVCAVIAIAAWFVLRRQQDKPLTTPETGAIPS